jgi:tetratricopeptide (TPR) repeat protein
VLANWLLARHLPSLVSSEAVRLYSQAIAGAEQDWTLFGNRSAAYLALGHYDEALADAAKAIQLNKEWGKGYFRSARALCSDSGRGLPSVTRERLLLRKAQRSTRQELTNVSFCMPLNGVMSMAFCGDHSKLCLMC